jgi:hypothetical protein
VDASNDDPYRSAPGPTVVERARPLTRRRSWRRVAGAALAVASGPLGILLFSAFFGFDWLGTAEQRREADARLRSLPFPITHDRPWAVVTATRPRPIVAVTVRLEHALDDREGEAWCRRAIDLVPRLTVTADGATITLTSWPWRNQDLTLLAQLMDSWGRALHAAHGIISVDVGWAEGGPTQSI